MPNIDEDIDTVRASRAGHTFHERWAARRALQLVFPNDDLFAIAVEGVSSTETARPGARAEEVAHLVLIMAAETIFRPASGLRLFSSNTSSATRLTAAYLLKKTIEKFSDTILGYEKDSSAAERQQKGIVRLRHELRIQRNLWDAIASLMKRNDACKPRRSHPGLAT